MHDFWFRPKLTYRVWRVFWRNFLVFKKTWLSNIMFNFIEPLLYLGALGLGLGAYVDNIDGLPYINWIAPGLIASSAMWATASECSYGSFVRMHFQKTFHAMIATPIDLDEVVAGEMLFGAFKSLLYGGVILVVLISLGLVISPWAVLIPFVLLLSGLAFAELGFIWTGLVPSIESFSYFFTLMITPMFLFSGVFFPLNGMPGAVEVIAWFMPLYHVVQLIRSLALGQVSWILILDVLWLLGFILLLFKFPLFLMKRRLID